MYEALELRAWIETEKRYINVTSITWEEYGAHVTENGGKGYRVNWKDVDMYTGVDDEAGVPIYTNDIVYAPVYELEDWFKLREQRIICTLPSIEMVYNDMNDGRLYTQYLADMKDGDKLRVVGNTREGVTHDAHGNRL